MVHEFLKSLSKLFQYLNAGQQVLGFPQFLFTDASLRPSYFVCTVTMYIAVS